ncbi:MAG: hypothetical protein JW809_20280 [Pirellulales bacterium]|nr:hypothetical protein [Pirellulales bacterium]
MKQLVDCRKALAESLTCAETIPDSFQKALAFVMIADLRLELGDKDEAIRLVDMVTAEWALVDRDPSKQDAGPAEDMLTWMRDGMEGLFVKPLILDVFIRADHVESAVELASRSDYPDHWSAIGAECAYSGQMGAVAKLDKDLPKGLPRAHFCLGVAEGLVWKMRAATQGEPKQRLLR